MHKSKALAEVCINWWTYTLHPRTFLWVVFTPGCTEVHRTLGALPYCCGAGRGHWKDTGRHQEDTERTPKTPRGHWKSSWVRTDRQYEEDRGHKNGIVVCVQKTNPMDASTVKVHATVWRRVAGTYWQRELWKPFRSGWQPLKWTCTAATSLLVCISILNPPTSHLTWFESTV